MVKKNGWYYWPYNGLHVLVGREWIRMVVIPVVVNANGGSETISIDELWQCLMMDTGA